MANLTYKGSTTAKEYTNLANAITSNVIFSFANNAGQTAFEAATSPSGVTVACGDDPYHIRTTNFSNYSLISFGSSGVQFYGIKWFKDKFITVGNSNNIYTSDANGLTWTLRAHALSGSTSINWKGIAVSNNIAVIVGSDNLGRLVTQASTDGITWTETTPFGLYNTFGNQEVDAITDCIIYDGSRFMIIAKSTRLLISTDGLNWSTSTGVTDAINFGSPGDWRIFFTNSKYVVSSTARILTSSNGDIWTSYGVNAPIDGGFYQQFFKIISIGNLYFALAFSTEYLSTDQGATWVKITNIVDYSSHRLAYQYENNKILVLGNYESKTTISSVSAVYNYGTASPSIESTIAKNAPLNAIEFDSNMKSLDDKKIDIFGHLPGSITYANSSGNLSQLAPGVSGNSLTVSSSFPVWAFREQLKVSVQEYKTPGSYVWTKPDGAKAIYVYLVGAGGGGGGGHMASTSNASIVSTGGGGGGAGGVTELMFKSTEIGPGATIVVGTGGSGGTGAYQLGNANSATSGLSGGNTSFSSLNAIGGGGGTLGSAWTDSIISNTSLQYNVGLGGSTGCVQAYGRYDSPSFPGVFYTDSEFIIPVGGSAKFVVNYNADYTLSFSGVALPGLNIRNGKNGKRSPGGGGAGGHYFRYAAQVYTNDPETSTKFYGRGASGGSGFTQFAWPPNLAMSSESTGHSLVKEMQQVPENTIIDVDTFVAGSNDDYAFSEGESGQAKTGNRLGAGGTGGAFGGSTINYSGNGGPGYWPGGGGGGGGGCFSLSGISSRAGNGGRGADGYALIVTIF